MGHCCAAHLLTEVTTYLRESKDNKVEVNRVIVAPDATHPQCDYCLAKAGYIVSYFG